ncbi:hypothetical protein Hamer_G028755 [Homarus americanus]|uniref:Uncharacterized protein n=1 Tax=Homarus americanus TaxID=6706 RepID=A0A8J5JRE1_HOMAM|nr:hypothetical protein Hamer_G028755 [Homarus americanus]
MCLPVVCITETASYSALAITSITCPVPCITSRFLSASCTSGTQWSSPPDYYLSREDLLSSPHKETDTKDAFPPSPGILSKVPPAGGCRGRSSNIFHDLAPTTRSFPLTTPPPSAPFSTSSTGDLTPAHYTTCNAIMTNPTHTWPIIQTYTVLDTYTVF